MSAVDQSDMIGAGASSEHPLLGMEMPQIPANEVSSLLGSTEEPADEQHHEDALPASDLPQMENMGYDQVNRGLSPPPPLPPLRALRLIANIM
jgi:hypothetical protein